MRIRVGLADGPVVVLDEFNEPTLKLPRLDETVTINFPLHNIGDGATTNLVATLLVTGGVNASSAPQTYGASGRTNVPSRSAAAPLAVSRML